MAMVKANFTHKLLALWLLIAAVAACQSTLLPVAETRDEQTVATEETQALPTAHNTPTATIEVSQVAPPARVGTAMVYDSRRQVMVLFGGSISANAIELNDTWEYDGQQWTDANPPQSPPPRTFPLMAYDEARGVIVMYGGMQDNEMMLADTWEYDGTTWTLKSEGEPILYEEAPIVEAEETPWVPPPGESADMEETQVAPSPRSHSAMAYDSKRQVMVLFGGEAITHTLELSDTWEYDGEQWRQVHPPQSPSPRGDHLMVYDAKREVMVLYGGDNEDDTFYDTWEYDGTTWSERSFSGPTPDLYSQQSAMVYDTRQQAMLLFGVEWHSRTDYETWQYDGVEWTYLTSPPPDVWGIDDGGLASAQMVYDTKRQVAVLQGRFNWTYEWDGQNWYTALEGGSPEALPEYFGWVVGMAYDQHREVTVMFGDQMDSAATWEYDGQQWMAAAPAQSPLWRDQSLMAYDEARQVVVMFGGMWGVMFLLNDTWEYDGTTWTLKIEGRGADAYYGP
jgi:hypothetical protein